MWGETPATLKQSLDRGTLYLGLLSGDEVLCSESIYTWNTNFCSRRPKASHTSALVPFCNQIPLPALSCPRPSFEINVVTAFPLCPQPWGMTRQSSWAVDSPRPRCAREPGPDAGERRALSGLFSISYRITEVRTGAVCLTNCAECEAITCTEKNTVLLQIILIFIYVIG